MAQTRIGVYARVSTTDQNVANQIPDIVRYLQYRQIEVPPPESWETPERPPNTELLRWYVDHSTGANWERGRFRELEQMVRAGCMKTVIVWKLDRLGRHALGIHEFLDLCRKTGTDFVSITEGFELSTAAGRLMAGVLASVADFERDLKNERQRASIERIKATFPVVLQLHEAGCGVDEICVKTKLRKAMVQKMLLKRRWCTWGGRKPGDGFKKLDVEKAAKLVRAGCNGHVVAKIFRMSRTTLWRRLKQAGYDMRVLPPDEEITPAEALPLNRIAPP